MKNRILARRISALALGAAAAASCAPEQVDGPAPTSQPWSSTGTVQAALVDPRTCEGNYAWSELIATAAEVTPQPSALLPSDTRAGSLEINFWGNTPLGSAVLDQPWRANITTLRNGAGVPLEQIQLNRASTPGGLDSDGCRVVDGNKVQCWKTVPDDLEDDALNAETPYKVEDSNAFFDPGSDRVTIGGSGRLDLSGDEASAGDGSFSVYWDAPKGIETARLNLRAHFDADANGDLTNDPFVTLLRLRWQGSGPSLLAPGVKIVDKTATRFEVGGNLADVLTYTCDNLVDNVCDIRSTAVGVNGAGAQLGIINGDTKPNVLNSVWVRWPEAAGKLLRVRVGNTIIWNEAVSGGKAFLEFTGPEAARTVAAQGEATLRFEFEGDLGGDPLALDVLLGFTDACLIDPGNEPPPEDEPCISEPPADVCATGGKPTSITLRYTGQSCAASSNQQGSKTSCSGNPFGDPSVYVLVSDKSSWLDLKASVFFQGTVALDQLFDVKATSKTLPANSWVHIFAAKGGKLLQTVQIHTSCSAPLIVGDQFGSLVLEGYVSSKPAPDSCASEPPPTEPCDPALPSDVCKGGKPKTLTLTYTGKSCAASQNNQKKKSYCSGDPKGATPVVIRATDKCSPTDKKAKVFFNGQVGAGESFDVSGGGQKLPSNVWLHISTPGGKVLQSVKIHTSCSAPLALGDVFGSLVVSSYVPSKPLAGTCPGGSGSDACEDGKPRRLDFQYTGESCAASSNGQDPKKTSCSGTPNFASPVLIRVTDKATPLDLKATVYFKGLVNKGEVFTATTWGKKDAKFGADTYVHISTWAGSHLQTLKIHTSCSQPLSVGDQFGSLILTGSSPNP